MKRRWVAVDNDDKYFKLYAKNKPYLNDKALFIPYSTSVKHYTESKGIPIVTIWVDGLLSSKLNTF